MRVHQLDTNNKKDVRQFVNFPFELYRHCPQWVPPLVATAKDNLDRRKHPYYRHSSADFFVVESEGQTLGRMAMLNNRNYNDYRGSNTAFFSYFEVVKDIEVARALFDIAFAWAKANGLTEIIGPRGLIGVDGSVLVEGFEHRPALTMTYNYPYYDAFIKDAGFEKDTDYLSGYRLVKTPLSKRLYRVSERVKKRSGFWVKIFRSKKELRQWVPKISEVHHQAFSQLHSYYPPSPAEMELIIDSLFTIADPRLVKLVMQGDNIVGFLFAYHDLSAGLQKANGRLWPLGWYHLLRERHRTNWVNVSAVGLLPEYRGAGGNALLYTEIERAIHGFDFEYVDMVQINEANIDSRSDMEHIGVIWYKRHRHYRRDIE